MTYWTKTKYTVTSQLMMFLITKVNIFFILNYQQFYFGAPELLKVDESKPGIGMWD